MLGASAFVARGFKIANYADTSGDPTASKIYLVMKSIFSQPIDGYVLMGACLANQEQWHHAHAIVKALREEAKRRPGFPVVILLAGNKEQVAHEIIETGLIGVPLRWELYGRDYIYDTDFIANRVEALVKLYHDEKHKEVLTGMRRGEILNLRWQDVDLVRRVAKIQSSATFKTKTGRRRTIPLGDVAYHLLQSRHGKSPSEYVFTVKDTLIGESWCSHLFKRYVDLTGLSGKGLCFHSLRHTFASWLVQDGVSTYEVQKLLGHSSITVTQVYSHLHAESLHATVNRLTIIPN